MAKNQKSLVEVLNRNSWLLPNSITLRSIPVKGQDKHSTDTIKNGL